MFKGHVEKPFFTARRHPLEGALRGLRFRLLGGQVGDTQHVRDEPGRIRLMDKILHDPKDPKLWELWYIPYNG